MKPSRRFLLFCKGSLAVLLVACLLGLAIYFGSTHSEEANSSTFDFESMTEIEQRAWEMASGVVGTSMEVQEQFVADVLGLYYKVKDNDLAIFCIPGGWGKEPVATNAEGRSWLIGMEAELDELGHNYCVIEKILTGKGLGADLFAF